MRFDRSCAAIAAAGLLYAAGPASMAGGPLGRWLDFDGDGLGGFYTSGPPPICTSCGNSPVGLPARSTATTDTAQMQRYLQARLEEQRKEAERRAEEQRLLEERLRVEEEIRRARERDLQALDAIRRLQDIDALLKRLSNPKRRAQYNVRANVVEALPRFERMQTQAVARDRSLLQRLSLSISRIHVPPPRVPPRLQTALFLGWFNTPADALGQENLDLDSPFTGRRYDRVFGFGSANLFKELARAPLDHLLGDFSRLSQTSLSQVADLKGATIEDLVAHSNGAKIAEVLIATDTIRVKRLSILGGDAALMNLERLAKLAEDKNLHVTVYAVQDDPIPLIPVGWQILEWTSQLSGQPLRQDVAGATLTHEVLGLTRSKPSPSARLQVHLLSYPVRASTGERHHYGTYHRILQGRRLQGCLDVTGALNARCRVRP